jgi:cystathionine beta-lyase
VIDRQPSFETRLVRAGWEPHLENGYLNPPIYRSSTVLYSDVASMEQSQADPLRRELPAYGRFGTPTGRAFELALTELEGGYASVVTCSGLAAVTTALMAFVKAGDHILVSDSVYTSSRRFCDSLAAFGIETEYYDPRIGDGIADLLRPNTRLVYLESPGSTTFEVQDIPAITSVCRARGVVTIVDNTWATPVFCRPLELGADVVVHSATKYLTGHADSILGAIVCTEDTYAPVRSAAIRLGQTAGADDVYMGLRGIRTLGVRLRQHHQQALELAGWLQEQDEVSRVLYPALPGDPGHELWRRDFSGAAGLFSIVLNPWYGKAEVDAMLERLRLFGLGHSWGGYESLIVPADPAAHRLPGSWDEPGIVLRVHVGLEDVEDLKRDLAAGLEQLSQDCCSELAAV